MSRPLTSKQKSILDFIREFHAREDRMPSSREVTARFGWSSQTAAIDAVRGLVKKGALEHRQRPTGGRGWLRFPRNASETSTPAAIHP